MIVVDASVAVKWFVPEDSSEEAAALLKTNQKLLAPELIRIEVAAALTRRLRMEELDENMTQLLLGDWRDYLARQAVSLQPTVTDFDAATQLSITLNHQLQDCTYLAVANRLNVSLLTADKKFFDKANVAGHSVELLAG